MHACFEAVLNINAMDKGYLTYPINKEENMEDKKVEMQMLIFDELG